MRHAWKGRPNSQKRESSLLRCQHHMRQGLRPVRKLPLQLVVMRRQKRRNGRLAIHSRSCSRMKFLQQCLKSHRPQCHQTSIAAKLLSAKSNYSRPCPILESALNVVEQSINYSKTTEVFYLQKWPQEACRFENLGYAAAVELEAKKRSRGGRSEADFCENSGTSGSMDMQENMRVQVAWADRSMRWRSHLQLSSWGVGNYLARRKIIDLGIFV